VKPSAAGDVKSAVVQPLAPRRYKIQITVSRETHDKLRRAQDLLRRTQVADDLGGASEKPQGVS
jgi:hypothetical protein